ALPRAADERQEDAGGAGAGRGRGPGIARRRRRGEAPGRALPGERGRAPAAPARHQRAAAGGEDVRRVEPGARARRRGTAGRPGRGDERRGGGRCLRPPADLAGPCPRGRAECRPRRRARLEPARPPADDPRRAMRGTTWLASGILSLAIASPAAAEPERFNRFNLRFNRWFLEHVLEPTARAYNFVMPKWGQRRVVAFMGNLEGPRGILNSLAQAKLRRAGVHSGRLVVNTIAGVVGLFDVAGDWLHWTASPE